MCGIGILKEFFNQEFFRSIIGALIGTGTSVFVFYLTIRYEKNNEKKKVEEDYRNRIKHFANLIESSTSHVERITSNLDEMISSYEENNIKFQLLKFSPNKSFERLEKLLKSENYFLSYVNIFGQKKIKNFNNISKEVDYFNMQIKQLWSIIKKAQRADYEIKNKFKDQVNDLLNLTASLTKRQDLLIPSDIKELESYIIQFHNDELDETDLRYFYEFIRKVLKNVVIKYICNQEMQGYALEYKETSILFKEIGLQNDNHKEELKLILEGLKAALKKYKDDAYELIKFN